jgi:hypothetical protein
MRQNLSCERGRRFIPIGHQILPYQLMAMASLKVYLMTPMNDVESSYLDQDCHDLIDYLLI